MARLPECVHKERYIYDYKLDGNTIPRTNVIRDLGVILDSRLTLQDHYEATVSKA